MPEDKKQPIVVKRIKKGHAAHHGGSWKVAYADFVTAMMAFFLLLWLLSQVDQTQREGISEWFKNPTGIQGPGGASTSMIKLGGALDLPRGEQNNKRHEQDKAQVVKIVKFEQDKRRLEQLLEEVRSAIQKSQALKPFKDQMFIDITPEGLRIQIVDKENRPMFSSGSAVLKPYTRRILQDLARIINKVPNSISISGHTDATPFVSGYTREYDDIEEESRYTNWELSADRANAARRVLVDTGVPKSKLSRVVGLASSVLFDKTNSRNPVNRRISIIVLNQKAEESIRIFEGKGGIDPSKLDQLLPDKVVN